MTNRRIKSIGTDMLINLVSYGLPIIVLQFFVLPTLAKMLDSVEYGLMISLTSVVSISGEMAGGNLANVRLIFSNIYNENKLNGDFKELYAKLNLTIGTIMAAVFIACYETSVSRAALLVAYFLLFSMRSYFTVGYRLELKYNMVFLNNVILCIGYVIGVAVAYATKKWELIYVLAFLLPAAHLYFTTKIRYDSYGRTEYYQQVSRKTIILMLAYLAGNSMGYFDRVLLYPMIGGTLVSNYHVATVFGKALALIITPINTVLLSYLSKKKYINKKEILLSFSAITALGTAFVMASTIIAPIVIRILYPDYVRNVIGLIPIATCATVLMSCSSIYKTLVMRYGKEQYIFMIEVLYTVIYVALGIMFLKKFSLEGFCTAATIAAAIRYILFVLCLWTNKLKE